MTEPELTIDSNGNKHWYLNGKRHREDGPAIEYTSGSKEWWLNGKRHREDGPAIEYTSGSKYWWLNGKFIMKSEKPIISKHMHKKFERLKKEFYASQVLEG